MFTSIARFDVRFRWLIVALWIVGAIASIRLLPSLSSITQSNNAQFLSSTSPSVRAANLAAPFQGKNPSGTAILVASSSSPLTSADLAAFSRVEATARKVAGVALARDEGVSRDGKATEALVTVTSSALQGNASDNVVNGIRGSFSRVNAPAGLSFHLTGQLAENADSSGTHTGSITQFTLIFVIVLLFIVYRALLAPLVTLIPAGLSVAITSRLVAELAKHGMQVPPVAQQLLIVLLLGAGTDYGLFLVFRMREEIRLVAAGRDALVAAYSRVGPAITYSGLTVAAALVTLLLAPFGIYRGIGPSLAIGIGIMLLAALTLTPALLAIFGSAAFWPSRPRPAGERITGWGEIAERVVRHPKVTLAAGVVLFGALSAGLVGYRTSGLTSTAPAGSDSAAGQAVLDAHFPKASVGADQVLLRFSSPVWDHPATLTEAQQRLAADTVFKSVTGPLGTGAGSISATELARLHATLGPAASLQGRPAPASVPKQLYDAYLQTPQFISPDGRTVQYYAVLSAGPVGSTSAAGGIPQARSAVTAMATAAGAQTSGITGQDSSAYDIQSSSNTSLEVVVPAVLVLIIILLAALLRSLVAPWYLAVTVGLSYLASLGFSMIIFVHLGGNSGLLFVLPLLMFVFSMALGEDYNILIMSRIREEAHRRPTLQEAVTHAIGVTGMTVTSAGLILAGTFAVLGLAGGNIQAQELGFSIAFGVLLDTFFVRTLLVPSLAILLGRWNWWPARLSRATPGGMQQVPDQAGGSVPGSSRPVQ